MTTSDFLSRRWTKHSCLGYTWEEMKILMILAKNIDAAKLQYKRLRRNRTLMRRAIKNNFLMKHHFMANFFIDLEFLFSCFQKINYLLRLLRGEKNKLLSATYSKNLKMMKHWKSARDWVEHPQKKIKKKRQKNPSDFGNMTGDYFSIAGEKYDVFNKSPKVLQDINKSFKKLFE